MGFTNSPLVKYTLLSPNHSGQRNHAIDTITIHCVVGHTSLQTLGNVFLPKSRKASSNYGVDDNGNVGMYVEEKNRSWCTSSAATTRIARSAPIAKAVRSVSAACFTPTLTTTTSSAWPFSFNRIASSTAISSNGFIDIFTFDRSTPDPSARTRAFTL